ncbi:hypothetical protein [Acinetobacter terrae]|uniref:Uncharacterized protein n=1 Tax=Acinetobacter terrae TaxID=2731247 RepID=A0A4R0EGC9_9GAMM|nr:hypothetical protein [Acinetobacter terrae]TCB55575.1 hypothetical protein E0H85_14940 [Acinetobacter terrae]
MKIFATILILLISSSSFAKQGLDEKYYLFDDDPNAAVAQVSQYGNFIYEASNFETFEYAVEDLENGLNTAIETDNNEDICAFVRYRADLLLSNIKYNEQYDKKLNKLDAYKKLLKYAVDEKLVYTEACQYKVTH